MNNPQIDTIGGQAAPRAVAPHHHERYAIALATAGSHRIRCGGQRNTVKPGDLVMINPGETHEASPIGGRSWSYQMAFIGEDQLRAALAPSASSSTPEFRKTVARDQFLATRLLAWSATRGTAPDPFETEVQLTELMRALVGHLVDRDSVGRVPSHRKAVRSAKQFLRENHGRAVRLAELAAAVGLNPNYLVSVFTAGTGTPPHQYLDQVRIARAQELISAGRPLTEVALAVGYCDQSHLTRRFKRALGVTPGWYRDTNRR